LKEGIALILFADVQAKDDLQRYFVVNELDVLVQQRIPAHHRKIRGRIISILSTRLTTLIPTSTFGVKCPDAARHYFSLPHVKKLSCFLSLLTEVLGRVPCCQSIAALAAPPLLRAARKAPEAEGDQQPVRVGMLPLWGAAWKERNDLEKSP
jgi:hypothetical protein